MIIEITRQVSIPKADIAQEGIDPTSVKADAIFAGAAAQAGLETAKLSAAISYRVTRGEDSQSSELIELRLGAPFVGKQDPEHVKTQITYVFEVN